MNDDGPAVLVHLGAGVGNIVLATPLLIALHDLGFTVDVLLAADYVQSADLLRPWSVVRNVLCGPVNGRQWTAYAKVVPAIPPFYWPRFSSGFRRLANTVPRPPETSFYQNEQDFYLSFARALGFPPGQGPFCRLPISPTEAPSLPAHAIVLAPGCKTGEMAAKRWPHFPRLAERLKDVAVVGTRDDLRQPDGTLLSFPSHVRSFAGVLTLRQTAELMASSGVVVGNDSGLAHVAAATGVPTVMIFGPTPHATLGPFPPNVKIIRRGLPCESCWFRNRFQACNGRISCLAELTVEDVARELRSLVPK
jgi:ADP-heptose:LPS heptosyltransferase